MQFKSDKASIFIPDNSPEESALTRCRYMAIGTHPDDVELLGMHGIHQCFENDQEYFTGMVVTNGAGSPRSGKYADVTDEEMIVLRSKEQNKAAEIGQYGAQIQLGYPSDAVKSGDQAVVEDLYNALLTIKPKALYLHNPFDRHDSHIAVLKTCIAALQKLPEEARPSACYGVEVWRSLDFLLNKITLPIDKYPELTEKLILAFDSQVEGGKRYDLAYAGRGLSNATFAESHEVDGAKQISFAVDLMPLVISNTTLADFSAKILEGFMANIQDNLGG